MADLMYDPSVLDSDESYQKELRRQLLEKMGKYERGLEADSVLGREERASESELARNLASQGAYAKAFSQIGSIGGKMADASPVEDVSKNLMAAQQNDLSLANRQKGDKEKLNQYLMGKMLEQEGSLGKRAQDKAEMEARSKEKADALARQNKQDERENYWRGQELAIKKKMAEKEKSEKTPKIAAGTAKEIGEFDSAIEMMNRLEDDYNLNASQSGSGLKSQFKGTAANTYEKNKGIAAQTIGQILEGGKLTDADYNRYLGMLPSATDTNAQAKEKAATIKALILSKKKGGVTALSQTGYDTSNIPIDEASIAPRIKTGKERPEDQATAAPVKKIVKKQYNAAKNKTRLVYSDGTDEVVDGQR